MPPIDLTTRPSTAPSRAPMIGLVVVAALAIVGVLALVGSAVTEPSYVDTVELVNDTPYGVDVQVRFDDDAGYLVLGRALPERETTRRQVFDGGDQWSFTFV